MSLPTEGLSGRITAFYRGWRDWVERAEGYDAATLIVIDDLAPPAPPDKFNSREDVRLALESLIEASAPWSASPDPLLRYSHAKLRQSQVYLNQVPGESVSRSDIERRGTRWVDFDPAALDGLARRAAAYREALSARGVSEEAQADYYDDALPGPAVADSIRAYSERWLAEFRKLRPGLRSFAYEVRDVTDPGPWRNMVVHDGEHFILRVNTAPHLQYTRGMTEAFALHEVCGHMVHLQELAGSQRVLETAPHLLCIATHTLDSSFVEGVAQYIAHYLPGRVEPDASLAAGEMLYTDLRFLVVHKNLMDLLENRITLEQACERHSRLLKGGVEPGPRYRRLMADSFFSSLCLNYASSLDDYRPLLERPDSPARDAALLAIFGEFYDSPRLRAMLATLTA